MGGDNKKIATKHFKKMAKHIIKRYEKYWPNNITNGNYLINKLKTNMINLRKQIVNFQYFMNYFKIQHDKLSNRYSFSKSNYICSSFDIILYNINSMYEHKNFIPSINMKFEDDIFPAPNNFDLYLKTIYGDYKNYLR